MLRCGCRGCRYGACAGGSDRAGCRALTVGGTLRFASHLHIFHDDIRFLALHTVFAGIGLCLEATFEVTFLTLDEVLSRDFGEASPEHEVVKFRLLLLLTVFVGVGTARSDADTGDILSGCSGSYLRVARQSTHEDNFVDVHKNR